MKRRFVFCWGFILLLIWPSTARARSSWFLDIETGVAVLGYNDVRVPNQSGTLFSLKNDLDPDVAPALRLCLGLNWGRHTLFLFGSPLSVKASGTVSDSVFFFEEVFPGGIPLKARYTFNSWRVTYRYSIHRGERWTAGIGLTAKIRDAAILVEGGGIRSEKTNVGFVPLLNFLIRWDFSGKVSLLLEGDALAAPGGQGRAEDVLLALDYRFRPHVSMRVGYRVIEGGADVDEVYNFAWINFFTVGTRFSF